jgi:hypothetical protein
MVAIIGSMPKEKTARKKPAGTGKKRRLTSRPDKESESDEEGASGSDSSDELEPVKSKKGEPSDNLRRRSEWFQKRRSGG